MNREEFINLSGVEVTLAFYTETVEPLYMACNGYDSKEAFVENWKKQNKANIVKAHAFDLDRASQKLALKDCNAADLERVRAENKQLQNQAETFETKFKAANSSWQEAQHMADTWKADYHKAVRELEQIGTLKDRNNELENEIIRLKARLFDMLEQGTK